MGRLTFKNEMYEVIYDSESIDFYNFDVIKLDTQGMWTIKVSKHYSLKTLETACKSYEEVFNDNGTNRDLAVLFIHRIIYKSLKYYGCETIREWITQFVDVDSDTPIGSYMIQSDNPLYDELLELLDESEATQ